MSLYSLWLQWQGHLNLPPVFILDISGNYKHTQGKFTLLFIKKSLLLLWFSSGQGKKQRCPTATNLDWHLDRQVVHFWFIFMTINPTSSNMLNHQQNLAEVLSLFSSCYIVTSHNSAYQLFLSENKKLKFKLMNTNIKPSHHHFCLFWLWLNIMFTEKRRTTSHK